MCTDIYCTLEGESLEMDRLQAELLLDPSKRSYIRDSAADNESRSENEKQVSLIRREGDIFTHRL